MEVFVSKMADDGGPVPALTIGTVPCDETTLRNIAAWLDFKLPEEGAIPLKRPLPDDALQEFKRGKVSLQMGNLLLLQDSGGSYASSIIDTEACIIMTPMLLTEYMPQELLTDQYYSLPAYSLHDALRAVVTRVTHEDLVKLVNDPDPTDFDIKAAALVAHNLGMPAPLQQMTLEEYAGYRREAALLARAR